jgi:hypothetical protein
MIAMIVNESPMIAIDAFHIKKTDRSSRLASSSRHA